MFASSVDAPVPVGFCPHCGYDQRGLSERSRCPECGHHFWADVTVERVHRWVEQTLVSLWSVSILASVGMVCGLLSLVAIGYQQFAGIVFAVAAGAYWTAGALWFAVSVTSVLNQRRRPVFRNVNARRRAALARWMVYDAVVVCVPAGWCLIRWFF